MVEDPGLKKDLLQIQDPLLGPRITLTLYLVTRAMPKAPGLDGPGWPAEGYSNWQAALFWESGSGSSVDWSCTCWSESSAPLPQLGHKISQGDLQEGFEHYSNRNAGFSSSP